MLVVEASLLHSSNASSIKPKKELLSKFSVTRLAARHMHTKASSLNRKLNGELLKMIATEECTLNIDKVANLMASLIS